MSSIDEQSGARPRRPFSTLRKESSADDDVDLYVQRQSSLVPLATSPFIEKPPLPPVPELEKEHHPDELKVYVSEIPWADLLLEIAMTTAFASLTDGTPILQGSNVASYLTFFAMVWWVWASQVAYNVRFRQSDWFHRLFVFFQFIVFCALAAFTNNFDITNGIANNNSAQNKLVELQLADFDSMQDIAAANYRENRLPTLNARGISIVMALSRVVLLSQYLMTLYHVIQLDKEITRNSTLARPHRRAPRASLYVHIGVLVFSFLCYLGAYIAIGKNPSESDQIAKLVLWYFPLIVEAVAHFVAAALPGRVRYPAEAVYARSSTVFIIILGGGLDKITNGFQYIVGNVSLGIEITGLILCAAVIFILQFTLYFGTSEGDRLGSRRALALFFFHYFYLSALIVTLQGISALLTFGNLASAMELPFQIVKEFMGKINETGLGVRLNETDFPDLVKPLNKSGIALPTIITYVNYGIDAGFNASNASIPYLFVLQESVAVMSVVLNNFKSLPDEGSILYSQMYAFLYNNPMNDTIVATIVNNQTYFEIVQSVFTSRATPALWFFAAGGSALTCLGIMCLINRWPRDKYEWGQTISRLLLGFAIIATTALDVHASDTIIDSNFHYQGSRIWFLAARSLVLPPYALALLLEQSIELILLYLAGRAYTLEGFHVFWRRIGTIRAYAPTTDSHSSPPEAYDPYKPETQDTTDTSYYPPSSARYNYGYNYTTTPGTLPPAFHPNSAQQPLITRE